MSEHRILLIENPARLSIDIGRLKIERSGFADIFVAPRDIAALCLDHPAVSLTVAVLRELSEAGATVLVSDARHHPAAMLAPLAATHLNAGRLRRQMVCDASETRGELWRQLVSAKLVTQAAALRALGRKGALRLERLAGTVLPGDVGNAEGQGARHYWGCLFPESFRRTKEGAGDPLNIRLNYGYAVLRSAVARALAGAGLHCALGIGHDNAVNAFNLADDFIEPYRFLVDTHVADMADEWAEAPHFDGTAKKELIGFFTGSVRVGERDMRLPAAIAESVASFVRVLDGRAGKLMLPRGFPRTREGIWASTDGE